jgi:protein arginine kinase
MSMPGALRPTDDSDVVMSCRVRLARNVAGMPFVGRSTHPQRREALEAIRSACGTAEATGSLVAAAGATGPLAWVDMPSMPARDRQLLWERHLISRNFADGDSPRAVALTQDERFSMMVNEEDHLRVQVLRPGNALRAAFDAAMAVDAALASRLDFAFHPRLGYLTECPTNVGCGIRMGVMVHLRALRLTNELEKVKRAAKELHLAHRGFHGEGTDATGDWFQISNQRTLGITEGELLEVLAARAGRTAAAARRGSRAPRRGAAAGRAPPHPRRGHEAAVDRTPRGQHRARRRAVARHDQPADHRDPVGAPACGRSLHRGG